MIYQIPHILDLEVNMELITMELRNLRLLVSKRKNNTIWEEGNVVQVWVPAVQLYKRHRLKDGSKLGENSEEKIASKARKLSEAGSKEPSPIPNGQWASSTDTKDADKIYIIIVFFFFHSSEYADTGIWRLITCVLIKNFQYFIKDS